MSLFQKSLWIFVSIVILIAVAVAFPTPGLIALSLIGTSVFVIWQTMLILKDKG